VEFQGTADFVANSIIGFAGNLYFRSGTDYITLNSVDSRIEFGKPWRFYSSAASGTLVDIQSTNVAFGGVIMNLKTASAGMNIFQALDSNDQLIFRITGTGDVDISNALTLGGILQGPSNFEIWGHDAATMTLNSDVKLTIHTQETEFDYPGAILIPTNRSSGLVIKSGGDDLLTFRTTTGSRVITIPTNVAFQTSQYNTTYRPSTQIGITGGITASQLINGIVEITAPGLTVTFPTVVAIIGQIPDAQVGQTFVCTLSSEHAVTVAINDVAQAFAFTTDLAGFGPGTIHTRTFLFRVDSLGPAVVTMFPYGTDFDS